MILTLSLRRLTAPLKRPMQVRQANSVLPSKERTGTTDMHSPIHSAAGIETADRNLKEHQREQRPDRQQRSESALQLNTNRILIESQCEYQSRISYNCLISYSNCEVSHLPGSARLLLQEYQLLLLGFAALYLVHKAHDIMCFLTLLRRNSQAKKTVAGYFVGTSSILPAREC